VVVEEAAALSVETEQAVRRVPVESVCHRTSTGPQPPGRVVVAALVRHKVLRVALDRMVAVTGRRLAQAMAPVAPLILAAAAAAAGRAQVTLAALAVPAS
jgi:hypothetical protein